jgi:opacity protein-like surface antigen
MYRWSTSRYAIAASLLGSAISAAQAQTCTRPDGFGHLLQQKVVAAWSGGSGEPCALTAHAQADTGDDPMIAGFVTHPFATGAMQARLRFDLDISQLPITGAIRSVQILSIGGTNHIGSGSSVFKVRLAGGPVGPTLRLMYSDPAQPGGYAQVDIPLAGAAVQLGFDVQLGSTGYIRYWLNADFGAAPTGRIPSSGYLDMNPRGPASGIALGLFQTTAAFRANHTNQDIVFRTIAVTDYIFRSSHE